MLPWLLIAAGWLTLLAVVFLVDQHARRRQKAAAPASPGQGDAETAAQVSGYPMGSPPEA